MSFSREVSNQETRHPYLNNKPSPEEITTSIVETSLPIESLLPELIQKIISFLNLHDLQVVALLSKKMRERAIKLANHELPFIKNFTHLLIQNLNPQTCSTQRDLLADISKNIPSQNFKDFPSLKNYILDVKNQLINVIKTLDVQAANHLKGQTHTQLPRVMDDLFESAIQRKISETCRLTDRDDRDYTLWNLSTALSKAGNLTQASNAAMPITNKKRKGYAFLDLSNAFIEVDKNLGQEIDEVINAITSIPIDQNRGIALYNLSETLKNPDRFDKVIDKAKVLRKLIEMAKSIPDESIRGFILRNFSIVSSKTLNFDEATDAATSILNENIRGQTLHDLSIALKKASEQARATDVANRIPIRYLRNHTLQELS